MAVCDMVVDLGVQPGTGQFPKDQHKILLRFEIPTERVKYTKDGKEMDGPAVISNRYTASMHEKANLRKTLASWRGKQFTDDEAESFDVSAVLGKPCLLNIVETTKGDKVYSNIAGIAPPLKGVALPVAELPLLLYTEEHPETFDKLPEWIRKLIEGQLRSDGKSYSKPDADGSYGFDQQSVPVDAYDQDASQFITDDEIPF